MLSKITHVFDRKQFVYELHRYMSHTFQFNCLKRILSTTTLRHLSNKQHQGVKQTGILRIETML